MDGQTYESCAEQLLMQLRYHCRQAAEDELVLPPDHADPFMQMLLSEPSLHLVLHGYWQAQQAVTAVYQRHCTQGTRLNAVVPALFAMATGAHLEGALLVVLVLKGRL